jgi:methylase of polypeptide subunit release factors
VDNLLVGGHRFHCDYCCGSGVVSYGFAVVSSLMLVVRLSDDACDTADSNCRRVRQMELDERG